MRFGFGLVGLLVCLGVVIMWYHYVGGPNDLAAVKAKKGAEEILQPMTTGGIAEARDSIIFAPISRAGKFDSLAVRNVASGGVMFQRYGLQAGDVIIKTNGRGFKDIGMDDEESATTMVLDAYARRQPITVVRNNITIELPQAPGPKNPPYNGTPIPLH